MKERSDSRDVLALARHALDQGAQADRPGRVQWDVAGKCERSKTVERHASEWSIADLHAVQLGQRKMMPITVTMEVPCRRCPACLRARARLWANRAQAEILAAARTWFFTLTLRPEAHYTMLLRARSELYGKAVIFEQLPPAEQFAERHRQIGKELTLWAKRIRKNSGAPLRILSVVEAHKSGLPHYHGLIHETSHEKPVRHALLDGSWPHGFTKFKLIPSDDSARKTAWYVCKYLTKDSLARVRASEAYGEPVRAKRISEGSDLLTLAPKGEGKDRTTIHCDPRPLRGEGENPQGLCGLQMDPQVGDPLTEGD